VSTEAPNVFAMEQSERASLCADFSWTLAGNVIYAAGQFFVLMILTKLLRPELVGQYALGLALVYPLMMLTNMQLRFVMNSAGAQASHFGNYLSLRLLATSAALAMILVVTQILRYGRDLTEVVLLVGVAYGVETISDVYYARLQLHDRMAEISKSMILRAVLSAVGVAVAVYSTGNLLWGMLGIAIARAAVLFGYDIRKRTHNLAEKPRQTSTERALVPRFDWKEQLELLRHGLPLGIVVLLTTLNSSIPNFFIKHGLGEREVGIFSVISLTISVGNMAVVSLGQAAFTRLARSYFQREFAEFASLLGKLLLAGAAIGISGMVISQFAGREILMVLFRSDYADRADLLPWIMAAGAILFMAQFVGFGLTAAGFYRAQVWPTVLALISLVATCNWLIAHEGLFGAIIAMLIAALVQFVASAAVLFAETRKHFFAPAGGGQSA
jgi:O-antigen/teichoic acid export membrane protein